MDGQGAVIGRTADEQQNASSVGGFLQGELGITERLELSAGLRHDQVRMTIDDRLFTDGLDDSGERTFREWTGSLGLSYRYHPNHQVYVTVGNAFETPTFTEFARPDGGGFNPTIEPQKALNREVGLRGTLDNGLYYELVAFSVDVDNELIGFDALDGRTYYENAGSTSRDGIELGLDWSPSLAWRWTSTLTLADYRFAHFDDAGQNVAGNRLPGQPRRVWHNALTWYGNGERFAALEAHYTGDYYAENANRVTIDDHWVVNLRGGDSWRPGGGDTRLALNLGIRNLLDEDYFENIRINAFGGRFYEPATGRTFFASLELGF